MSTKEKKILSLLKEAKRISLSHKEDSSLVSNCFYLSNGDVLALRNPNGDSRHPYSVDGLTLWAYASGNIYINESDFFVFPPSVEGIVYSSKPPFETPVIYKRSYSMM